MTEQATLQKALYTIKKLKQLVQEQKSKVEPIALIGLSCRFPQAIGKEGYWEMLTQGRNVISRIPQERWDLLKGSDEITLRDAEHPYWGGYLSDISAFDAYFFGISPREALRMDPQHRLLLEVAYEAMEDAGLTVEALAGSKTGVFSSLYVSQLAHMQTMDTELDALYLPTGNAISIAANRLSYLFDLRGPSVIIDSACSSSMASLHLACLNLQSKACDLALVCGAKLNLLPYVNFVLTKASMLSVDGQCKTFDASANGYAQGEGVIVLKPLSKALQDKDRIYGVITGTAINQDGKTNGLTAPNGLQQEDLLKTAYLSADVDPSQISYVECHGTGTFLGDPIEIQALGEVIGKKRDQQQPCWIGSVKTNIGHLEPAAGVASIIKVALALDHKEIPPHLNFSTPNPHIAFDKYHLRIPQQVEPWPKYGDCRVAGMSGFGFGGTNAHVVMREVSEQEKPQALQRQNMAPEIFTLSAKDTIALSLLIDKWCVYLENNPSADLAQLCYNTHLRRSHYTHRLAVVVDTTANLVEALSAIRHVSLEDLQSTDTLFVNIGKNKAPLNTKAPENLTETDAKVLAQLYIDRVKLDWKKYEADRSYPHLDMPLYPWQHKNYWPPLGIQHKADETKASQHPLQGKQVTSPLKALQFEFIVDPKLVPDLQDTYNIVHAGYYMEMLTFAVKQFSHQVAFTIDNHEFIAPLIASNNAIVKVQLIFERQENGHYFYHFYSNTVGQPKWLIHAAGELTVGVLQDKQIDAIDIIKKRCQTHGTAAELYERVIAMGMPAGESIRWTQQYWLGENEILCEFQQPSTPRKNADFALEIHPGIIDASIQPLFRVLPDQFTKPYIASSTGRMKFHGIKSGPYYLYGQLKSVSEQGDKMSGDCWLINKDSELITEFQDIWLTQLDNKIQVEKLMESKSDHDIDWSALSLDERKEKITQFLVEQIAIIFAMPAEDIEINRSLREMGIDSLMALVLMRTLDIGLGVTYSMEALLEGPSISELADVVAQAKQQVPVSHEKKSNPWIAFRERMSAPSVRLFCFPYGGGGASIYRDWQRELPDLIEVCPIQLPGRESRLDEKPIASIAVLIDALVENLRSEMTIPFAFFGHSFGSLIGFELARALRKRNLPLPIHLFSSAFPDPRVPTKSLDNLLAQLKAVDIDLLDISSESAISQLSEEKLKQLSNIFSENGIADYGDHLMNKDIIKVLLPIFIGDMGIVKSYQYQDEKPLDVPMTVFVGTRDTWVAPEDHLRWLEHTQRTCQFHEFDSGHLFIKDTKIRKEVLATIERAVAVKVGVEYEV